MADPAAADAADRDGSAAALAMALPVGRIAAVQGQVYFWDPDDRAWTPAEPGRPLASGDRVSTGPVGRAELQVGDSTLRLHSRTELDVAAFDAEGLSLALRRGSLALRVRSDQAAARIEVVTPEARLLPARPGHFRFDRGDAASGEPTDRTQVTVWQGVLEVAGEPGFRISRGEQVELWQADGALQHAWGSPAEDVFAERVLREDAQEDRQDRLASTAPPVALTITGASDLARHGRWDRHPEFGWVWLPLDRHAGWAPYQQGRWVWVRPWGWTWIDQAPWAFATYHGGRWLPWGTRWAWAPHPVGHDRYAPGRSRDHAPGYAPLAPRERFLPPGAQRPPAYGPPPRQRPPSAGRPEWRHVPRHGEAPAPLLEERKDWRMRMPRPEPAQEGARPPRAVSPAEGRAERGPGPRPDDRAAERPVRLAPEPPRTTPAAPPPRPLAVESPQPRLRGGGDPAHEHAR